jgi:uncharacterized protein YycO
MKLTEQQAIVLFDIAKAAMNVQNGFAGYSNQEIMKLLNDIISQQDNEKYINLDGNKQNQNDINQDDINQDDFWN